MSEAVAEILSNFPAFVFSLNLFNRINKSGSISDDPKGRTASAGAKVDNSNA